LEEAIERLKAIYEKQRQYPATREILTKLMGYGGLNGASATIVSALSKYGLIEGHGDNLRVSDMGQDLVLHRVGDPEYMAAVQAAAFMPAFFREMRDRYPHGLPSEHSLRADLIKRGFNPKAIDSAVRAYRDTIAFVDAVAEWSEADSQATSPSEVAMQTQAQATDFFDPKFARKAPPAPSESQLTSAHLRSIQLPYSHTEWATLQAAFPLDEAAWDRMMVVLDAMKPVLGPVW